MAQSQYQKIVNKQTGAMGPVKSAYWRNLQKTSGPIWSMKSTPLVFSPVQHKYITAFAQNEPRASISFTSFGKPARRAFFSKGMAPRPMQFGSSNLDYDDLDFGTPSASFGRIPILDDLPIIGRRRSYRKRRRRKSKKSRKRRRKSRRKSQWKGWKAPKRVSSRREMLDRCGPKCFLIPNYKNPQFPICTSNCKVSKKGVMAAYKRARQWGYNDVASKAARKLKQMGYTVHSNRKHKRRSRRRRKNIKVHI